MLRSALNPLTNCFADEEVYSPYPVVAAEGGRTPDMYALGAWGERWVFIYWFYKMCVAAPNYPGTYMILQSWVQLLYLMYLYMEATIPFLGSLYGGWFYYQKWICCHWTFYCRQIFETNSRVCSALLPRLDDQVIMAKAMFNGLINGAIYLVGIKQHFGVCTCS